MKITRSFEGVETDLGKEAFKEKGENWVAVWKFKGGPGVYSFEFAGEIEDRYEDHPASDDPKDLDIQGFRSKLAVSLPVEVDIVSDQTDDAMPWNCLDPSKYAKLVTTLSPEGALGAFTLKIMDGTTVIRTLVAGENRAGGTWTDAWNGLKDDATPADAKAYTLQADWIVPDAPPAGDEEYPLTILKVDSVTHSNPHCWAGGQITFTAAPSPSGSDFPGGCPTWTATLGSFPNGNTGPSVVWQAPTGSGGGATIAATCGSSSANDQVIYVSMHALQTKTDLFRGDTDSFPVLIQPSGAPVLVTVASDDPSVLYVTCPALNVAVENVIGNIYAWTADNIGMQVRGALTQVRQYKRGIP